MNRMGEGMTNLRDSGLGDSNPPPTSEPEIAGADIATKRCGSCKYFAPNDPPLSQPHYGRCNFTPLPEAYEKLLGQTHWQWGTNCLCYESAAEVIRESDLERLRMVVRLYRAYNSPEPEDRKAAFRHAMQRAEIAEAELQNNKELIHLLRRASRHLNAWHSKYGENNPGWPPPAGDVQLQETIAVAIGEKP